MRHFGVDQLWKFEWFRDLPVRDSEDSAYTFRTDLHQIRHSSLNILRSECYKLQWYSAPRKDVGKNQG